jgi:hypothetical protein
MVGVNSISPVYAMGFFRRALLRIVAELFALSIGTLRAIEVVFVAALPVVFVDKAHFISWAMACGWSLVLC